MNGTKDFAFVPYALNETENQKKGIIVFCYSSMSVAAAEGSRWETAAAILMLRCSMMP